MDIYHFTIDGVVQEKCLIDSIIYRKSVYSAKIFKSVVQTKSGVNFIKYQVLTRFKKSNNVALDIEPKEYVTSSDHERKNNIFLRIIGLSLFPFTIYGLIRLYFGWERYLLTEEYSGEFYLMELMYTSLYYPFWAFQKYCLGFVFVFYKVINKDFVRKIILVDIIIKLISMFWVLVFSNLGEVPLHTMMCATYLVIYTGLYFFKRLKWNMAFYIIFGMMMFLFSMLESLWTQLYS